MEFDVRVLPPDDIEVESEGLSSEPFSIGGGGGGGVGGEGAL